MTDPIMPITPAEATAEYAKRFELGVQRVITVVNESLNGNNKYPHSACVSHSSVDVPVAEEAARRFCARGWEATARRKLGGGGGPSVFIDLSPAKKPEGGPYR